MTKVAEPGVESYGCQLFKAPPEGLYVRREDVRFTPGGHHVLLYKTPYTDIPERDERGLLIDGASIHDCSEGATSSWKVTGVLGGSESFNSAGMLHDLPEGVALAIDPGTVVLMSTHYLNATPSPVEVDARINLYTIPKSEVVVEAGVLYLDNPVIRIPAAGSATARMRCPISKDISIVSLQSHMHSRGVSFAARVFGEGSSEGTGPIPGVLKVEEVYTSAEWQEPPVREFAPLLQVAAGGAIEHRCDYRSTEPRDVVRGLTADDEMCQLIGPYFPRDPHLEACEDDSGVLAATWIGSGTATCAETLECLKGATSMKRDGGYEYFDCVLESSPEIASKVSEIVRCHLSQGRGACSERCATGGETSVRGDCDQCLAEACADAESACGAAEQD